MSISLIALNWLTYRYQEPEKYVHSQGTFFISIDQYGLILTKQFVYSKIQPDRIASYRDRQVVWKNIPSWSIMSN